MDINVIKILPHSGINGQQFRSIPALREKLQIDRFCFMCFVLNIHKWATFFE